MESPFNLGDVERIYNTLFRVADCVNLARLAIEYGVKEAAESKTSFEFDINWQNEPTNAGYKQVITIGQQLFFLYAENILLAIIYYQRNAASARWFYKLQDFGESPANICPILPNGQVEFTHAIPDQAQGPFFAHGPVIFASEGPKGESMLYADGVQYNNTLDGLTTWSFTFAASAPTGALSIAASRYDNGVTSRDGFNNVAGGAAYTTGDIPIITGAATPTTFLQTVSDEAFFTIVTNAGYAGTIPEIAAVLSGGIQISVTGKCSVWSHYPCEDVWASITNYASGETLFLANNLTLWNPNRAVPMSATIVAAKLLNPTDDVNIRRYCLGGDAVNIITTLGTPSTRKSGTWKHGMHSALLPADPSWQNYIEVLTAASSNASSGIYDAKYRRSGSGRDGVQRSQVKVFCITCAGVQGATVLEGMTIHGRVASAWLYTSSKQTADSRMPGMFPDTWSRAMCVAQATYPVYEDLDANCCVPPIGMLIGQIMERWNYQRALGGSARQNGTGIARGLDDTLGETQQLKRQAYAEAADAPSRSKLMALQTVMGIAKVKKEM